MQNNEIKSCYYFKSIKRRVKWWFWWRVTIMLYFRFVVNFFMTKNIMKNSDFWQIGFLIF